MSKKKGNAPAEPQDAGTGQAPKLKKDLRKDMRVMFDKLQRIDKTAILTKYLALHPDREEYIRTVLDK